MFRARTKVSAELDYNHTSVTKVRTWNLLTSIYFNLLDPEL